MQIKRLLLPLIALMIALAPAATSQAATHPHGTVSIGSLTWTTGTNGCTGPTVLVYGSSALKNYVLATASDYCTYQQSAAGGSVPAANAIDVEYLGGGDSCPGEAFITGADGNGAVANASNDPLGASDVFAGPCGAKAGTTATTLIDNNVSVNLVQLLMQCPGATTEQGGVPSSLQGGTQVPCTGTGSGAAGTETFPAPNNLTVDQLKLVLADSVGFWNLLGGANVGIQTQQRSAGSGTRITMCYNVFGVGADGSCANNTSIGAQGTSGGMENGVCGPQGGSAGDPIGTIGYSSRGTTYKSSQGSATDTLRNCGYMQIGGSSGWNGTCDASQTGINPATGHAFAQTPGSVPNSDKDSANNQIYICPGDLQVSTGAFAATGYEHFDYNGLEQSTFPATKYVTYLQNVDENKLRAIGFMQSCEMNVQRGFDGGPFSANSPTC